MPHRLSATTPLPVVLPRPWRQPVNPTHPYRHRNTWPVPPLHRHSVLCFPYRPAFSANSQAKVAANAIRGELTDSSVVAARYNNTCWSLISPNNSVRVGATYQAGTESIEAVSKFISQTKEDPSDRKANYEDSVRWYRDISIDMFS